MTALALVLGGHVLLVILFSSSKVRESRPVADVEPLLLIELPELPAEIPPPQPSSRAPREPSPGSLRSRRSSTAPPSAASESQESTAITEAPRIDWSAEAGQTARRMGEQLARQRLQKCTLPGAEELDPECRKQEFDPRWNPEPPRFGIQGGLPFMRLGERCVVGLGFFGCAIGKLPEADGTLFDPMRNPDRPHSSVPENANPGTTK